MEQNVKLAPPPTAIIDEGDCFTVLFLDAKPEGAAPNREIRRRLKCSSYVEALRLAGAYE